MEEQKILSSDEDERRLQIFAMMKIHPNNVPVCLEDLEEMYSQKEKGKDEEL